MLSPQLLVFWRLWGHEVGMSLGAELWKVTPTFSPGLSTLCPAPSPCEEVATSSWCHQLSHPCHTMPSPTQRTESYLNGKLKEILPLLCHLGQAFCHIEQTLLAHTVNARKYTSPIQRDLSRTTMTPDAALSPELSPCLHQPLPITFAEGAIFVIFVSCFSLPLVLSECSSKL